MQGVPPIPLDVACWVSLGVLALGMLTMLPVWWSNHRGWYLTMTPQEVRVRKVAFTLTTGGMLGLVCTGVAAAERNLSAGAFMICGGIGIAAMLVFAFAVDARARRRH